MRPPSHLPRTNGNVIHRGVACDPLVWRHRLSPSGFVLSQAFVPFPASISLAETCADPQERQAMTWYKAGQYDSVLQLLQSLPDGLEPGRELVRYAILSDLKLGRPEEAWKLYPRLVAADRPDDVGLLRDLARSTRRPGR